MTEKGSQRGEVPERGKILSLNNNPNRAGQGPPFFPLLHLSCKSLPGGLADFTPLPHISACRQELGRKPSLPICLNLSTCVPCQQEVNFRVRLSVERVRSGTDNVAWRESLFTVPGAPGASALLFMNLSSEGRRF